MEMLSAFTDVLHVANLSTGAHLISILKQSDAFTKEDLAKLASKLSGRKASIGVKKLLGLIDMVKQTDPRYPLISYLHKVSAETCWARDVCCKNSTNIAAISEEMS